MYSNTNMEQRIKRKISKIDLALVDGILNQDRIRIGNNAFPWSGQRAVCCFTLRFIKYFPSLNKIFVFFLLSSTPSYCINSIL
ncbi:hypothetical protein NC653_026208 [Populus alba x Populus x berolinensis]|uniref:Uncharacterized protein n=2 Tax=Populus alba x Populus x berolinensis TaxID=444605 RepID=A0AAD6MD23_9ROSI|nr:hypothetical protein NC653_026208 [Populus alba x Populus x berolinensis]